MCSYVFRERLKYKCSYKNKKLKIINESYISKICSFLWTYEKKNK